MKSPNLKNNQLATLAGGCFWCIEAVFKRVKGVNSVTSGYTGGTDKLKHAEAVQISFESSTVSYQQLLDIFFHIHDPTQLNKQGYDIGPEYRSAIFYHDEEQKQQAESYIHNLKQQDIHAVTQVEKAGKFFKAEDYHLNFYEKNPNQPYCQIIIDPKIQKLFLDYKKHVKDEYLKN